MFWAGLRTVVMSPLHHLVTPAKMSWDCKLRVGGACGHFATHKYPYPQRHRRPPPPRPPWAPTPPSSPAQRPQTRPGLRPSCAPATAPPHKYPYPQRHRRPPPPRPPWAPTPPRRSSPAQRPQTRPGLRPSCAPATAPLGPRSTTHKTRSHRPRHRASKEAHALAPRPHFGPGRVRQRRDPGAPECCAPSPAAPAGRREAADSGPAACSCTFLSAAHPRLRLPGLGGAASAR
mmetsp:Transcript_9356/g.23606  ORF Transcript_9356/g.23606 Transcript_9356/m.23606 type:complete len:232 (-) Transcript_9356:655-1350(-)